MANNSPISYCTYCYKMATLLISNKVYCCFISVIAWNIWRRTETKGVKLSNVQRKFVKSEETQQRSCAGNLEKALLHELLLSPFLVLTAQDSSVHKLVSLAICALTDAFLSHTVDQMIFINYDGQRRRL